MVRPEGGGVNGVSEDLVYEMPVERADRLALQGGNKLIAPPESGVIVPRPGKPPPEVTPETTDILFMKALAILIIASAWLELFRTQIVELASS